MLWVLLGWKCNVPCVLGHFWQNTAENCCEHWTGVDVQVMMTTQMGQVCGGSLS